jgi:hypothetical protein
MKSLEQKVDVGFVDNMAMKLETKADRQDLSHFSSVKMGDPELERRLAKDMVEVDNRL